MISRRFQLNERDCRLCKHFQYRYYYMEPPYGAWCKKHEKKLLPIPVNQGCFEIKNHKNATNLQDEIKKEENS